MTDPASSRPAGSGAATAKRPSQGRRYLTALDGLRALCALAVIIIHAESDKEVYIDTYIYTGAIAGPLFMLFFAISGFVIYRAWARRHLAVRLPRAVAAERVRKDAGGGADGNILGFILRRLLRIYPLYWVVATSALIVNRSQVDHSVGDYIQVYLLSPFPNTEALIGLGLGIVVWTLVIDIVFYLYITLHGVAVGALLQRTRIDPFRFEVFTLSVMAAIFPLLYFVGKGPWPAFACLPLGMLYAVLDAWQDVHQRRHPFVTWVVQHWYLPALVYVPAFIVGTQVIRASLDGRRDYQAAAIDSLWVLCLFVVYGMVFLACIIWGPKRWAVNRALTSKAMVTAGALTYGTYLWHPVVLLLLARHAEDLTLGPVLLITLVGSIALATTTYHLLELPLARQRTRLRGDGASSVPAATRRAGRRPSARR